MHAIGHVGSMTVPVFLAGRYRSRTATSRFFFHSFDWTFQQAGHSMDRIGEALLRLDDDIEVASRIVEERTRIGRERLASLYGKSTSPSILKPAEAKALQFVQDVLDLNPDGVQQPNVIYWTV